MKFFFNVFRRIIMLLSILVFALILGEMNEETYAEWNETSWYPCSRSCNCSQVDDLAVAKCNVSTLELRENFTLPDDTLIL